MFEVQSKIKRQVEILGICLNRKEEETCTRNLLSEIFDVELPTIDRDLKELRDYGINIHSTKHEGIILDTALTKGQLAECIAHYASINFPTVINEKATDLLVEKRGSSSLCTITMLQYCIEQHISVLIVYNKKGEDAEKRIVDPVKMFLNEGAWRLLAKEKGKLKQFIIYKILACESTKQRFTPVPVDEYSTLFKYSWKSWLGEEKYEVRLKLSPKWGEYINSRMFTPYQKITQTEQGDYLFEATVNSLREITTWIISMGAGIEVLEPGELKQNVISLAEGVLSNYCKPKIQEIFR